MVAFSPTVSPAKSQDFGSDYQSPSNLSFSCDVLPPFESKRHILPKKISDRSLLGYRSDVEADTCITDKKRNFLTYKMQAQEEEQFEDSPVKKPGCLAAYRSYDSGEQGTNTLLKIGIVPFVSREE